MPGNISIMSRHFPRAVSAVHSACPDRDGRRMLAENLAEEEGIEAGKQDHASLWLMFACGLGENEEAVRAQQLNAETEALIDTFRRLSRPPMRRVSARSTPMRASSPASRAPRSRG